MGEMGGMGRDQGALPLHVRNAGSQFVSRQVTQAGAVAPARHAVRQFLTVQLDVAS